MAMKNALGITAERVVSDRDLCSGKTAHG